MTARRPMGTTKDDPMDLGPFVQNYVMKNPFDQISRTLQCDTSPPPHTAAASIPTSDSQGNTPPRAPKSPQSSPDDKPPPRKSARAGGYLGSNMVYAYQLKNSRLSGPSADLQEWLAGHYRHVTSYGGIVGLAAVLRQVKDVFPAVTTPLLTKLMKTTFPNCSKFYSEGGIFYQGLVERPQTSEFEDSTLLSCVESVRQGVLDLGKAMASFAVEEARIVRMLVWEHNTVPSSLTTPSRHAPRMRLRKRSVTEKVCDNGEWSDSEEPTPKKCRDKTEPRRKSRRHRRRPSYVDDFECSLGSVLRSDGPEGDQDGPTESNTPHRASTPSCPVRVKEEAVDVTSTEVSSTCVTSPDKDPALSEQTAGKLEQQDVMEELAYMEGKLRGKEDTNKCLLLELTCARKEADDLRLELTHRDSQVSRLADEFFTLHNMFQKLQHQFKQYLTSSLVKNEELGIVNNNNVNGSL